MSDSSIVVFLFDPPRSGEENMSVDAWLLEHAMQQRLPSGDYVDDFGKISSVAQLPDAPIVVRIYRWQTPTLSLGHFQSIEQLLESKDTQSHPSLRSLPWVKRRTGGGAILHDREWTYSITVPKAVEIAQPRAVGVDRAQGHLGGEKGASQGLYQAVHRSIAEGLRDLGLDAEFSQECTCPVQGKKDRSGGEKVGGSEEGFLCFNRRSPLDLVVGGSKILGSAQRRGIGGIMQHGSLLMKASDHYPAIKGIEDCDWKAGGGDPFAQGKAGQGKICAGSEGWEDWLCDRIYKGILDLVSVSRVKSRLKLDAWADTMKERLLARSV
jgi:lipoate-protein ligase A